MLEHNISIGTSGGFTSGFTKLLFFYLFIQVSFLLFSRNDFKNDGDSPTDDDNSKCNHLLVNEQIKISLL